jgi:hypothetical protein
MTVNWDDSLYHFASECMDRSLEKWKAGQFWDSWGYTLPARLAYLADSVLNCVILPFALIKFAFSLPANWKSENLKASYHYVKERSNHLFIALFGAVISPYLANKYRDANVAPYIIAARITVISGAILYYALTF